MTTDARGWTPAELRRAIWLGYGGHSPDRPATGRLAAEVGVSARSLQRWLRGDSLPSAEHAAQLRAALAPPRDVLTRQDQDRQHARAAVVQLEHDPSGTAAATLRKMKWDQPHTVWIIQNDDLQIRRVTVTRSRPARPIEIPPGWYLVDRHAYSSRPLAVLARTKILEAVGPWRILVRPEVVGKGRHEAWLASAPKTRWP